jgi:antitoxin ParD1/3/4
MLIVAAGCVKRRDVWAKPGARAKHRCPIRTKAMMTKVTRTAFRERSDDFASSRVSATSDVVPVGSRTLDEQETKLIALREALEEGQKSRVVASFSLERVLTRLRDTPG